MLLFTLVFDLCTTNITIFFKLSLYKKSINTNLLEEYVNFVDTRKEKILNLKKLSSFIFEKKIIFTYYYFFLYLFFVLFQHINQ